ncbi:meiosis-specific protein ASY1 isoform X1 [Amaranthus tricolor]|uniref:meiosis-specific protein ASY1 isoform X1 n=1 Tax=Amaranthus tricolor TaxID=29722 RepID=UPI00258ED019|nr:meiosis-specific protein ASY1 isoform X1 [Amaranthus tricolor]
MVVAQKVKEAEITEQESLLLTRNLLRIAIFNISYIRGLFPEKYFNDKNVPALEMKIKKLMPLDAESRRLIDWMEKGVYDALQKKYLRTLLFCICEAIDGPIIEEYAFSFSYPNAQSQEVCMNFNRSGNKKQGGTFKCNATDEVTPNQMKSSACKMIRTLVQLMRTLDKMPEERTILMKLLYNDDVTPADYEPPFFRGCTDEDARNIWKRNPLKMEVGNVNSKHVVLALKVKSVLDPCEDDNEVNNDDSVSLGADSVENDDASDSGSEASSSQEDQYIVQPIDQQQPCQQDIAGSAGSEDTQDPLEDELQLNRIKDWIISSISETVGFLDVLANFPDISRVLIEEIMDKLVLQGVIAKSGKDAYTVCKQQKDFEYEFDVKTEIDDQVPRNGEKVSPGSEENYLYMKALYHALPMDYVSVSKLQSKLDGDVNQPTVRKLIDKMTQDGFVEATSKRGLGKRVIHSDAAEQKLHEVRKALDFEAMDVDVDGTQSKLNSAKAEKTGNKKADVSTFGVLHSIGSDVTRMRIRSETDNHQNGSLRTDQSVSKTKEGYNIPNTPTSKNAQPAASLESTIPGTDKTKLNRNSNDVEDVISSRQSQDKRSRKASTVKEPIIKYYKRQKSQAAY